MVHASQGQLFKPTLSCLNRAPIPVAVPDPRQRAVLATVVATAAAVAASKAVGSPEEERTREGKKIIKLIRREILIIEVAHTEDLTTWIFPTSLT